MAKKKKPPRKLPVVDMAEVPDATGELDLPPPLQVRRKIEICKGIRCPDCSGENVYRYSGRGRIAYYKCRDCFVEDDRRGDSPQQRTFKVLLRED